MKCQKCGKNNANVSYTRIVNGEKTELHLCSDCAKEMNINVNLSFGFDEMFSNFFEDFARVKSLAMPSFTGLRNLNMAFDDLMNDSLFDDIPFFKDDLFFGSNRTLGASKDNLDDVLAGIQKKHQKEKNTEKRKEEIDSKKAGVKKEENVDKAEDKKQKEINQLKAKIQEYIKSEEYEKAAVLRNQIKKLES